MQVTGTRLGQTKNTINKIDKKSTAVIAMSDLNRMKIGLSEFEAASNKEEDRKRLKELSNARVKNWPNTVKANRDKKENERFEKFKKEEMERRVIDKEEAEYQA
jgi:3-phosphoglycerate kinase